MQDRKIFNLHFMLADQERRIYAKWGHQQGISLVNIQLLICISNNSHGAEPSVLADEMLIPRQTMTGLLDQLEKKKLISRKRDVKDRRKVHIYLEKAGQAMLSEVLDKLLPHETVVVQSIDAEEFKIFNKVYAQIVAELSKQLASKE